MATEVSEHDEKRIRRRQTVRVVLVIALVVLVLAFAVDNAQRVDLGYLVGDGSVSLWAVIAASFLAGGLAGAAAARNRS